MFLKTDYAQKNGGKLVSDINDADYVVLGHHKSQNFDHWLRQAEYFHKLAVQWLWVHQCVEERVLVDVIWFHRGHVVGLRMMLFVSESSSCVL